MPPPPSPPPPPEVPEGGGPTASDAGGGSAAGGRRSATSVVLAIVGAFVLAGVAVAGVMFALRGTGEVIATKVPGDSDVFVTAYLDPAADQKTNLSEMMDRFPALRSDDIVGRAVDGALDSLLAPVGLSHADVEPWLGSQAGVVVRIEGLGSAPSFAVLVDAEDEDAARSAMEKLKVRSDLEWSSVTYNGVEVATGDRGGTPEMVTAFVDGAVVVGNNVGFLNDVIDTAAGDRDALVDAPRYVESFQDLPQERLGAAYVDLRSILDSFGGLGALTQGTGGTQDAAASLRAVEGVGTTLSAEPEGLFLDFAAGYDPGELPEAQREALAASGGNELLGWVPGDSYGVYSVGGIDAQIEPLLESIPPEVAPEIGRLGLTGPDGLLAHLTGDLTVAVGPGSGGPVGFSLMLGGDDDAAMQRFLDGLAELAGRSFAQQSRSRTRSAESTVPATGDVVLPDPVSKTPPLDLEWKETTVDGVRVRYVDLPDGEAPGIDPAYAVVEGMGVFASSPEEIGRVLDARDGAGIEEASGFTSAVAALEGMDEQVLYLDPAAIGGAIRDALPPAEQAAYDLQVSPNLEPIQAFVVGSSDDPSGTRGRLALLVK